MPRHGPASFDTLVESLSRDIRPRAVLDELLRQRVVEARDDGQLALLRGAFVPTLGFEEKAFYFGRNLRDHIAASAANLLADPAPHFERTVYYARLSPSSVDELRQFGRERGMEVLRAINERAAALQEADAAHAPDAATQRISFGAYLFDGAVDPDTAEPGTAQELPR